MIDDLLAFKAKQQRQRRILMTRAMWGGFYRCPTTGRCLAALEGDDKVLCTCRTSNPKVPKEATEYTGTHLIQFLDPVSIEEYVDQEDRPASMTRG